MSNGFLNRFQGKIKVGSLWIGAGGLYDAASGIKGLSDFVLKVPLPVTAVANTDLTASLPPGGSLISATVYTTVAYTAGTDAKISLGVSAGDASYVAAATIKALGIYPLTLLQPAAAGPAIMPATPNVFIRVAQSGTATAVGTAFLLLQYTAQ